MNGRIAAGVLAAVATVVVVAWLLTRSWPAAAPEGVTAGEGIPARADPASAPSAGSAEHERGSPAREAIATPGAATRGAVAAPRRPSTSA